MPKKYSEMNACEIAAELAESNLLKTIIFVKTLLCIGGLVLITLFLKRKGLSWLAHPHTQCMFMMHLLSTYMATSFYLICFLTDLWRFGGDHRDPCDYALPFSIAFTIRLVAVTGTFGQLFSMASIAVERMYASIRPVSYERLNSTKIKGGLSALVVTLSFGLVFGLCVPGVNWNELAASFTIRTKENQNRFQWLVNIEVLMELGVLLTFHFSLYLNFVKKISTSNYVAARYQIMSNKKIIILLLPIFWTHFVCIFVTSFGLVIYPYVTPSDTPVSHGVFLEMVALAPLYATIMPLLMFYSLQKKANANANHEADDAADHFRTLEALFAAKDETTGVERVIRDTVRGLEAMFCCKVDL